ncbi:uncharacterized protein LOC111910611 [Lactuca sativa]|uniref:uncharacterized protein LOC111910611 n=1 Tax=Lactuca sativa TaxID=4236 RepID=UPI0022AE87DE|nr:uncharacterized protein LOC111910611 [Lactuca sativa]
MGFMGFGDRWRSWIHGLLKNARSSILVNGNPTEEFQLFRGLRQAIEDAVASGNFRGVKVKEANLENVDDAFLLGVGVNQSEFTSLASISGCAGAIFPFSYLGIPVGGSMSHEDQRCIHWVKWDIILKSRDKGGLEVGSLDAFNRDLLFKWKWRFLHDHSTLWLRLIKGLHGDFGDLANNFGLLEVMDGLASDFWNYCGWNFSWRCGIRGGVEAKKLESFMQILTLTQLTSIPDRWSWSLDPSGVFLVSSTRRLRLNRIPICLVLVDRGVELESILCPVCQSVKESVSHIFLPV